MALRLIYLSKQEMIAKKDPVVVICDWIEIYDTEKYDHIRFKPIDGNIIQFNLSDLAWFHSCIDSYQSPHIAG